MRLLISLFSPATGTWGGLTRVLALAKAAERAGHRVAFCASGSLETDLHKKGYQVYSLPPATMLGLPAPVSRLLERRSQYVSLPVPPGRSIGNIWLVMVLSGMAHAGYLHRAVAAELDAARDFKADVLFTDLDPGTFLLGKITKLPLASAYARIVEEGTGSLAWELMHRAMGKVLKTYGLPSYRPEELFFGPSVLKIIPSIPELDGSDPEHRDVCYVGHLLGDIQLASQPKFVPKEGQHYVFVYVGTGSISLDRLEEVLPKVFPAGGETICLVGAQSISRPYRKGAIEFRPYVPASAVLPFCDWTLCHGGQNTIIQSLRHGVPLLVFPGPIFERRFNAWKVQATGAGRMGELYQFKPAWLQEALTQQPEFVTHAVALSERIHSFGGPEVAVSAIASLVRQ